MAKIQITYFGLEGEGATVKEAKLDACMKIEQLVAAASQAPVVIAVRGYAALVGFNASSYGGSWGSRLIMADGKIETGPAYLSSGDSDKHTAMMNALRHVATLAWSHTDDDDAFAQFATEHATGCPLNHSDRREMIAAILENARFQRKYMECRFQGMNDREAHAAACGYRLPPA